MTREVYKEKKIESLNRYREQAQIDMNREARRNKRLNATRRYNRASEFLNEYEKSGFWTPENELSYTMIYKNTADYSSVSPF